MEIKKSGRRKAKSILEVALDVVRKGTGQTESQEEEIKIRLMPNIQYR